MYVLKTYYPACSNKLVKLFWCLTLNNYHPKLNERIIPDGHPEIILHLQPKTAKRTINGNNWIVEPESFLVGQALQTYDLTIQPQSFIYGIRLQPHALKPLFGIKASEVTDSILPVDLVFPSRLLMDCLSENINDSFQRLEQVMSLLCARDYENSNASHYIQFAVDAIQAQRGNVSIKWLLQKTGISQRWLNTIFREWVGVGPKQFSEIVRVNHLIEYKNRYGEIPFFDCSYEMGYADQSHFNKNFKRITGLSPSTFFSSSNSISTAFASL